MREKKGTKVSWIGEIPLEWELKKIKCVFKTTNGYGFPDKLQGQQTGDIPFLKVSDFPKNSDFILSSSNYVSLDTLNKKNWKTTEPMSIITAKIGEAMKKNHRKISVEPCLIDNNMMSLSVKKGHLKYFFYASKIIDFSWFANPGAVPSLNHRQFRESYIMSPPIAEQQTIANFLNKKTSEIDTLIEDKEKLIALLEEKRQAIITEAVTKGLNPNVKMKDSGVEWIGEIPEHWDIEKMKYLFKIKKRIEGLENPNILSVTQRGVKVKDISSNEGQLATSYDKYQTVEIGDFVMNHMDLLTGFIDNSKFHGVTSPDYRVFSIKKPKFVKQYFLYYFQMNYSRRIFYKFGQGVANFGRWRLPTDEFYNFYVPVPPAEEQKEIVEHISGRLLDIESVIEKTKETIGKLKEYRQSLIYEAVTGKIDVQEMLEETEQEEVSLL